MGCDGSRWGWTVRTNGFVEPFHPHRQDGVFVELTVENPRVGGSIPSPATIEFQRLAAMQAVFIFASSCVGCCWVAVCTRASAPRILGEAILLETTQIDRFPARRSVSFSNTHDFLQIDRYRLRAIFARWVLHTIVLEVHAQLVG